jgi:phosphatidylinositol 4-kinase
VPAVTALKFLQPAYGNDPFLLQYAMRVLEQHSVSVTFFYTPQVVQALRTDELGAFSLAFTIGRIGGSASLRRIH